MLKHCIENRFQYKFGGVSEGFSYTCTTRKTNDMLELMAFAKSDLQAAARGELERILASPGFIRNERLGRFLRFVVEKHLEGRDDEVKEYVIILRVFGLQSGSVPRQDISIVRTEASRLRARLSEYYLGDGKDDPLIIELPKGRYVPVLRQPVIRQEFAGASAGTKRPPRRIWLVCGIAFVFLPAGAAVFWRWQQRNAPISIAVLPLINLSQEPNSDYFADGLTGEVIRDLSIIDGLVDNSRTSSFAFKGQASERARGRKTTERRLYSRRRCPSGRRAPSDQRAASSSTRRSPALVRPLRRGFDRCFRDPRRDFPRDRQQPAFESRPRTKAVRDQHRSLRPLPSRCSPDPAWNRRLRCQHSDARGSYRRDSQACSTRNLP